MEYFNNIEKAQAAYDEYYAQAFTDVRERIIFHFKGDNWTNEQVEAIIGEPISAEWLDHYLPLHERIDDVILTDSDFDLTTLISYAKDFGIDLSGVNVPYKMIILDDGDYTSLDNYDKVKELLSNENDIGNILVKYIVCQNRNDLAEAWEENLSAYEGFWYGIKDDDSGIIIGGTYDPNDIMDIAELPSYDEKPVCYEMACKINGYIDFTEEQNARMYNVDFYDNIQNDEEESEADAKYINLYKSISEQVFQNANFGDCQNVSHIKTKMLFIERGKDFKFYIRTSGFYRCKVEAFSLDEAQEKAEELLKSADFKDISEYEKVSDFVCCGISRNEKAKNKNIDIERE